MFGSKPEPKLDIKEKMKTFGACYWRGIITLITPIIFLFVIMPPPTASYQWCGYTLCVMAVYWMTECIPLAVTSFLPVIIFPMTGVLNSSATCKCYMNDTVMMFLGSLMLAASVEQSGLHKRLALLAIRTIGYSHKRLLFAMSFITMFVSMWVTNTAATTMMVPINFALLKVFQDLKLVTIYETDSSGSEVASDMTVCYFCTATYSATIGGIGTLLGTGTNLTMKELFVTAFPTAPEYLSFPMFSAFTVPYMLVLNAFNYLWMSFKYLGLFRPKSKTAKKATLTPEAMKAAEKVVLNDLKSLGRISYWEVSVFILFGGAMVMFFCRSPQIFPGWGDIINGHFNIEDGRYIRDSATAAFVIFLMFLLPSNLSFFNNCKAKYMEQLPKRPIRSVLDWRILNATTSWSFAFLLGGGFALSTAAKPEHADLNSKIGEVLAKLNVLPNELILLILVIITVIITNFASNVAVCNVITPIAMTLAVEINQNPLWYNVATGIAASFCFMLPVGTPGNLVVQSAAKVPTPKMMVAGSGITVVVCLLSWLFMWLWAPIIWPDLKRLPGWIKG